jgi:thiamine-phosphate pyrophosphorylase
VPAATFSLLAISDRRSLPAALPAWCRELALAGVEAVQLREKDLDDRDLFELAAAVRPALGARTLLINGRADVALAAGAEGVHLPADGPPIAPLRACFGERLLLGRSTHRVEEVEAARSAGADYVTFGPVYSSPGKGEPVGLPALRRAAAVGIPIYALGGVKIESFEELAATGVRGVAGIRLFHEPRALPAIVARARQCFRPEHCA